MIVTRTGWARGYKKIWHFSTRCESVGDRPMVMLDNAQCGAFTRSHEALISVPSGERKCRACTAQERATYAR